MAGKILVTPEELRNASRQFKQTGSESQQMVQRLESLMNGMNGQWEGMTAQKFFQDYNQWKGTMKSYVDLLNNIGTQLDQIATRFEQADRS